MKNTYLSFCASALVGIPALSFGISINDTIGLSGAATYGSQFDAVVGLGYYDANGDAAVIGTGVLIDSTTILTAKHNVALGYQLGDEIFFGADANDGSTVTRTSTQIINFVDDSSDGDFADGSDLAILKFANPITNITPYAINTSATTDLYFEAYTNVGYGFAGVGSSGVTIFDNAVRYAGQNIVEDFSLEDEGWRITADFDDGTDVNDSLGGLSYALPYEAATANGDSGGPLLLSYGSQWLVGGILNAGYTPDGNANAAYGEINIYTSVEQALSWIDANSDATFVDFTVPVPEPTSALLLGLGGLTLVSRRQRK